MPSADRPSPVSTAVKLLYAALGLGLLSSLMQTALAGNLAGLSLVLVLGLTVAIYAVFAWLVSMIGKGRNWARIIFAVLFALGLLLMVAGMVTPNNYGFGAGVLLGLLQTALQLTALVMLFGSASNAWFREGGAGGK